MLVLSGKNPILFSKLSSTLFQSIPKVGCDQCGCRTAQMLSCFLCCVQDLLTANLIWRIIAILEERAYVTHGHSVTSQACLCSLADYTPYSVSCHSRRKTEYDHWPNSGAYGLVFRPKRERIHMLEQISLPVSRYRELLPAYHWYSKYLSLV